MTYLTSEQVPTRLIFQHPMGPTDKTTGTCIKSVGWRVDLCLGLLALGSNQKKKKKYRGWKISRVFLRGSLGGCVKGGVGSLICRARGKSSACASPRESWWELDPRCNTIPFTMSPISILTSPRVLSALLIHTFFFFLGKNSSSLYFFGVD